MPVVALSGAVFNASFLVAFYNGDRTFDDARRYCAARGGELAHPGVTDEAELSALLRITQCRPQFYLGAERQACSNVPLDCAPGMLCHFCAANFASSQGINTRVPEHNGCGDRSWHWLDDGSVVNETTCVPARKIIATTCILCENV